MDHEPHIEIFTIGNEAQPVIVIDGFVPDPGALVDEASGLRFGAMGPHYPGVRAPIPLATVRACVAPVADLVARTFGVSPDLGLIEAMYSIVTTPAEALRPIQRLPHFDGCEPERLALLLYLGGCEGGGTAFYRHRATGFETVGPDRLDGYRTTLNADVAREGIPQGGYIAGDTPMFERIARFDGVFNRALIYRGQSLHCADLAQDASFSADPRAGRLTANTFLMGVAP